MKSSAYWKAVLVDRDNFLDRVLEFLKDSGVRYCVIGGTGVNAYSDPVVTEDLDIVVAAEEIASLESALGRKFKVRRFPHSINVSAPPSKLQLQIQTDPRYFSFVDRSATREVMDYELPVATSRTYCREKSGLRRRQHGAKVSGKKISPILHVSLRSLPNFAAAFRKNSCRNCCRLDIESTIRR